MSRSHRSSRHRTARLCGPVAAALALGALSAAPASATVSTTNPVEDGENITVFHNIDFVATFGVGTIGQDVRIDVIRNGVTIGTTTGPLVDTPDGAALEANHGPAGAPQPGDCFVGHTPDILPRDVIEVTNLTSGDVDSVTVDDIGFLGDAELLPNGDIIQKGYARRADGTPIPIASLDSNGFLDTSKFRGPAHQVIRTPGTTDGFTNIFNAPYNMERNDIYPTVEQRRDSLLNAGGHEAGFGHVAPLPLEAMLVDGNADTPGPAPGCEASPSEANRVTGGPSHINAATGDITITGTKMTAADTVDVTLTDSAGNTAGPLPATVTGNTWSLTVSAAQRAGLVDGDITAAGTYDHGGTLLEGKALTIAKDVVAPTLTATPGAGTFTGATSVALTAGPGEQIRYRTDGGQPSAGDSLYTGPIALPFGTTVLGVRIADAAGNVTFRTLTYTVNRPPVAPPVVVQAPAPALPQVIQGLSANRPAKLVATARRTSRVKLSTVRRNGLGIAFTAPDGTKNASAKLYRLRGSSRTLVASKSMRVGAGRRTAKFAGRKLRTGSYLVQIRVGTSSSALGAPANVQVQIVR